MFFNPYRNQEVFWFCLVSCVLWCLFLLVQESAEELSHPAAEALMGMYLKLEVWGLQNALHGSTDYLCFGNKGKTQLRRDSFAELAHCAVFILEISEWWPCSWLSQVPGWLEGVLSEIFWNESMSDRLRSKDMWMTWYWSWRGWTTRFLWSTSGLKIANKLIYSAGHKQHSRVFNTGSNITASLKISQRIRPSQQGLGSPQAKGQTWRESA